MKNWGVRPDLKASNVHRKGQTILNSEAWGACVEFSRLKHGEKGGNIVSGTGCW